ncbi:FAD:protein FMN transferase [Candidatus Saccharibacteria bacterium]|nr:FAD:protein FMN transferase [Candidatus Saccharibacteria bacterium]
MQHYQETVALGSKTGLSIVSTAPKVKIEALYHTLWREIFLFERRFSRFLPASELSIFNRNAGTKQVISPEFQAVLVAARDISQETAGLYNPFILPALQSAGYVNSRVPGHETNPVDDHSGKTVVPVKNLEIGDGWARIPFATAVDLGGCGKGYLADLLRERLPDIISGYWLSFGGDIAVGGRNEQNQPWTVLIQSAADPAKNIASLKPDGTSGVATSGINIHTGIKAGEVWHHIIDPRTLRPAKTDILLATVSDKSALRADVLASCAVILGGGQAMEFLKQHQADAAVLQFGSRLEHFGDGIIIGNAHV